ncbi:MAG TPA: DMT family transporter, partial [Burkholderiaceae bacterium]|nr:DMT family transporter [Burkholderiaceae bacterium]
THLLWSLLLSRGILGERVGLIGWAGCLLAFAGIVLLSWPGAGASLPLIGVAFGLIGAFSSAVGNIAIRRAPGISNVALNVWGSVIALPVVLVVAWALEGDPSQQMGVAFSTPAFVAAFAFQALVGSALCFPAWTRMIAKYGVSRVTPFTLLVPLFAVASTTLFLGEQWTPRMLAALAIVVAGLSVVQLLPRFVRA